MTMTRVGWGAVMLVIVAVMGTGGVGRVPTAAQAAGPEGMITWGLHVTLASRWLDPAETEALATPFMVL